MHSRIVGIHDVDAFSALSTQNNPYSNTYNPGWKNHPNFSWANDQGTLRNLEIQVGQLANLLNNGAQGTLPSDTEVNLRRKGKEQVMAITLRSGEKIESGVNPARLLDKPVENEIVIETTDKKIQKKKKESKGKLTTITLCSVHSETET
ncbi:Uncharacterized protein TCM_024233 [Theobroma cacao]|uniref:Uncharacterized protein n=1 Tax=Theobroma cacao TaxID=3641 RepID=A0A061EV19_THECC|nr:Uncharacterized protein TCM_024233 [Theobroma cacao]